MPVNHLRIFHGSLFFRNTIMEVLYKLKAKREHYFQTTEPTSTGSLPSTSKVSGHSVGRTVSSITSLEANTRWRSVSSPEVNKHVEGVIQSAKFPAAQPPDPNQPSKIETEYWPCPPSLAAMGNRHRSSSVVIWAIPSHLAKFLFFHMLLPLVLLYSVDCSCWIMTFYSALIYIN